MPEVQDLLAGTELARGRGFGGDLDNDGEHTRCGLVAGWQHDRVHGDHRRATRPRAPMCSSRSSSMPAGGGEPRRMTGTRRAIRQPQFAPDGSALYALGNAAHEVRLQRRRASCASTGPGPSPRPVAFGFDRSVGNFRLRPMANASTCSPRTRGTTASTRCRARGGEVRELGRLEAGSDHRVCRSAADEGGSGRRRQLGQRGEPAGGDAHRCRDAARAAR